MLLSIGLIGQACCTIPPVVAKGYQTKGKYIEIDGMKTCRLQLSEAFTE